MIKYVFSPTQSSTSKQTEKQEKFITEKLACFHLGTCTVSEGKLNISTSVFPHGWYNLLHMENENDLTSEMKNRKKSNQYVVTFSYFLTD